MPEKHGVYAVTKSSKGLSRGTKVRLKQIRQELETPEGIRAALLQRATRGLVMLSVLEDYVERSVADGLPLDEVKIAARWAGMQNAVVRTLKALQAAQAAQEPPDGAQAILDAIKGAEHGKNA